MNDAQISANWRVSNLHTSVNSWKKHMPELQISASNIDVMFARLPVSQFYEILWLFPDSFGQFSNSMTSPWLFWSNFKFPDFSWFSRYCGNSEMEELKTPLCKISPQDARAKCCYSNLIANVSLCRILLRQSYPWIYCYGIRSILWQ